MTPYVVLNKFAVLQFLVREDNLEIEDNIKNDKLGQRQSQTPFSSALWVQKDFDQCDLTHPNLTCHNLI